MTLTSNKQTEQNEYSFLKGNIKEHHHEPAEVKATSRTDCYTPREAREPTELSERLSTATLSTW